MKFVLIKAKQYYIYIYIIEIGGGFAIMEMNIM